MQGKRHVLIMGEDEDTVRYVNSLGFRPIVLDGPHDAPKMLRTFSPAFVLINLPNGQAQPAVLRELSDLHLPIIVVTDSPAAAAKLADKRRKIHALSRPVSREAFQAALQTALPPPGNGQPPSEYLVKYAPLFDLSAKMREVKAIIELVADTSATILIRGESGVGKDLIARAIHSASPRRDHPFVKVNCAALPTELLESELFGHEKGAFTGAYRRKPGKFEFARSGTIFLDEIGELPLGLQAKLLHVLQDEEFSRVGGREIIHADARVIASTNRDLEAALLQGQFREDLYYRLNVVEIHIPPLRERKEEIPSLVRYFLDAFQLQYRRTVELQSETIALLTEYSWPGNVRELENIVRRLVVLGSVEHIHEDIGLRLRSSQPKQSEIPSSPRVANPVLGLREIARRAAQEAERIAIKEVLDRVHWNRSEAARLLRISYKTLLSKIAECGLPPKQRRPKK